jgi:succinyl-CoA synthetase alpha subunit
MLAFNQILEDKINLVDKESFIKSLKEYMSDNEKKIVLSGNVGGKKIKERTEFVKKILIKKDNEF